MEGVEDRGREVGRPTPPPPSHVSTNRNNLICIELTIYYLCQVALEAYPTEFQNDTRAAFGQSASCVDFLSIE